MAGRGFASNQTANSVHKAGLTRRWTLAGRSRRFRARMFDFLLPKHIRQGRNLLKDAKKLLAYKRDLWSDATVSDYEANLRKLEKALRENKLTVDESRVLLKFYENGLEGYTYLE